MFVVNADKPKNCYDCQCAQWDFELGAWCSVVEANVTGYTKSRHEKCPIMDNEEHAAIKLDRISKIVDEPLIMACGSVGRARIKEVLDDR